MIKPSGAVRLRGEEAGEQRDGEEHRDSARCTPDWRRSGVRRARAAMALGRAAVWKNCSSFATVFRSSVPSTVFHAPLCFPNASPRLHRVDGLGLDRSHSPRRRRHPLDARVNSVRPAPYGELFVIIAFPPNERKDNGVDRGHVVGEKKHSLSFSLFFPLFFGRIEYRRGGSHGRVAALVRLRSTFFPSAASTAVLFMPAPLLPPDRRRLPKRERETIGIPRS